jgi:hypothetical protein
MTIALLLKKLAGAKRLALHRPDFIHFPAVDGHILALVSSQVHLLKLI